MSLDSGLRIAARDRGPHRGRGALDEHTFHQFLSIERQRAERSGRCVLLLLMEFEPDHALSDRLLPGMAPKLFSALVGCVREIDIVGWYRADSIAGVLLAQRADTVAQHVTGLIAARVADSVRESLPSHMGHRMQVRVHQLQAAQDINHA